MELNVTAWRFLLVCLILAARLLLIPALPASAQSLALVRLDDPAALTFLAFQNEIDVQFTEAFAREHMIKRDYDGVRLSHIDHGHICFESFVNGLREGNSKYTAAKDFEPDFFCSGLAEASARVAFRADDGKPRPPVYNSNKSICRWRWVTGGGVGFWGEDCANKNSHREIAYARKDGVFVATYNGKVQNPVLRVFDYEPAKGPEELLATLKAKGLVTNDKDCVISPFRTGVTPQGWLVWAIGLAGERGYEESSAAYHNDQFEGPACGAYSDYGFHMDLRFFMVSEKRRKRIVFVNLKMGYGQIDPFSITPE